MRATLLLILAVVLTSCATARASTRPVWGVAGDSITYGWGSTGCTGFPGSGEACDRSYAADAGVPHVGFPGQCLVAPGCSYTPLVQSFPTELATLRAQGVNSVVVEIGVNDLAQHITDLDYRIAYNQLIQEGQAAGMRVVLSTITPGSSAAPFPPDREAQRGRVNDWMRSLGPAFYVDYSFVLGGGVIRPELDSGDGLHPNDAGHAAIAKILADWISRA